MTGRIVVVEDNPVYAAYVRNLLEKEGLETQCAGRLSAAKKQIADCGDDGVVVADFRLPDGDANGLLRWMRGNGFLQPFIIMTDYPDVDLAVEGMRLGSADYIRKRLVADRLMPLIRRLTSEREQKRKQTVPIFKRSGKAFTDIKRRIHLVAPTNMGVLILGENGTGKEHLARMVHEHSRVKDKPFVAVDCGSLSPELAQSAFFGHVKGAFTGAEADRKGYFKEADGGTLFLDEVGNLPMDTQRLLLRALQKRCFRPVGAGSDCHADVRIVAATNEDLQKAVSEKRFRQDLLFRLQEYVISVPPLRESKEDIMPLADFFRGFANEEMGKSVRGFDAAAQETMLIYPWPGNVRELRQVVRTAVLQAEGETITKDDLALNVMQTLQRDASFALKSDDEEKERIVKALKQAGWNKKIAAKLLGIGRTTLYYKMEQYGLK